MQHITLERVLEKVKIIRLVCVSSQYCLCLSFQGLFQGRCLLSSWSSRMLWASAHCYLISGTDVAENLATFALWLVRSRERAYWQPLSRHDDVDAALSLWHSEHDSLIKCWLNEYLQAQFGFLII